MNIFAFIPFIISGGIVGYLYGILPYLRNQTDSIPVTSIMTGFIGAMIGLFVYFLLLLIMM